MCRACRHCSLQRFFSLFDSVLHSPCHGRCRGQHEDSRSKCVLAALLTLHGVQGMPRIVKSAKIACLDMNLQKARMLMGVQVLVSDPAELEKIRQRESDIIKERIQKLLDAGANVVLTTKGIDDLSLKYLVEAGVLGCRRVSKEDLRSASIDPAFLTAHNNSHGIGIQTVAYT